jgi:hypothetical protein
MLRWLRSLARWFKRSWQRVFGPAKKPDLRVQQVEEFDSAAAVPFCVYVEHRGGKDRWVHMLCPCECGEVISLNLMTSQRPCWTVTRHEDGTVSVYPSVDKTTGCKSHFFIRRSMIEWAGAPLTN